MDGPLLNTAQMTIIIRLSLIVFALASWASSYSQILTKEPDGRFLDEKGKPYTGVYSEYHENGQIKFEISLRKGRESGNTKIYFDNGKLNEIRAFSSGVMHGTWKTWDDSGNIIAEANYRKGNKHGNWFVWDEKGTLRYDMNYKKGNRTGIWIMYDEAGAVVSKKSYN